MSSVSHQPRQIFDLPKPPSGPNPPIFCRARAAQHLVMIGVPALIVALDRHHRQLGTCRANSWHGFFRRWASALPSMLAFSGRFGQSPQDYPAAGIKVDILVT